MRTLTRTIVVIGCALGLALGAALSASADDEAAIKYRQSVMKALNGHIGGSVAIVKGQVPYKDDLVAHATGLNDMAMILPNSFKQKTSGGKTRAKAIIWEDNADFQQKIKALQSAASDFLAAAKSGGPAAAGAKLGPVGEACKGCHKKFREKKS